MPNERDKSVIIERVEKMLSDGEKRGIHLRLAGSRFDDQWLYLVVELSRQGGRASQHAHYMTEIERALQKEGFDQVLLVPALPEHAGMMDTTRAG